MKKFLILILLVFLGIIAIMRSFRSTLTDKNQQSLDSANQKPALIDRALQRRADSLISAMPSIGSLGLILYDITEDAPIYTYNENVAMRPASCMKLLSCITAMKKLGVNYTYKTRLYTTGKIVNDTLVGNLILKTQFDPFFNRDSLITLLGNTKKAGIKAIKGNVILDVAITEAMDHEQHWTIGDLKVARLGLLYRGYPRLRTELLYALHGTSGINIHKDSLKFGRLNPHNATLIGQTVTPLHFAIEKALKNSSNINAESLLYPLGYTVNSKGKYRENGITALRRFIVNELHLDAKKHANLEDGCGLCPDDRLSPTLLCELLKYATKHPRIFGEMMEDLPLSGTDGTLYDRLRKPNVLGKIKAKTGTLTREGGISTLSGYYTGIDGHLVAFVIMNNECPVMDGRWWQDKFCERVMLPKQLVNAAIK